MAAEAPARARALGTNTLLVLLLVAAMLAALAIGQYALGPGAALRLVLARIAGLSGEAAGTAEIVLFQVRLPRILAAVLVGAALAAAGSAYQGLFRNGRSVCRSCPAERARSTRRASPASRVEASNDRFGPTVPSVALPCRQTASTSPLFGSP